MAVKHKEPNNLAGNNFKQSVREWLDCIGRMLTIPILLIAMLLFVASMK